jgi:geranylgeranyl diphosphate synthase type I
VTSVSPQLTTGAGLLDREDLRQRVDAVLAGFLKQRSEDLAAVAPECLHLVEAIGGLLDGGKRLRPAFCYWGWRGAGGPAGAPRAVTAAAALEFFQAAALIHDDLMDASDTRRGRPAVHAAFAARHREAGWLGPPERFGAAGAVLAGDLSLVWADDLFEAAAREPGRNPAEVGALSSGGDPGADSATDPGPGAQQLAAGRATFGRMRSDLLGGQYLDVLGQAAPEPDLQAAIARARHVIRYKSAKYSVEHPLLIGGALAGAGPALLAGYSMYGLSLGEAFQLRDDVLGVFGDPAQTGKPAGDDLREGKRTVLIALTLQRADPEAATEVHSRLGDPSLDADGVRRIRAVVRETGALDAVEDMITKAADAARAALASAPVADPAAGVLDDLVTAATSRVR